MPDQERLFRAFRDDDILSVGNAREILKTTAFEKAEGRAAWPPKGLSCDREVFLRGPEDLDRMREVAARRGYREPRVAAVRCADVQRQLPAGAAVAVLEVIHDGQPHPAHTQIWCRLMQGDQAMGKNRPKDGKDAAVVELVRAYVARRFQVAPQRFPPPEPTPTEPDPVN